jgi:hypothetical protein
VRAFRDRFVLSQSGLAALPGVGPGAVAAYGRRGGPPWLRYALAGLARSVFHASLAEAGAMVHAAHHAWAEGPDPP